MRMSTSAEPPDFSASDIDLAISYSAGSFPAGVEGVDAQLGPKFPSTPMALEVAQAGLGLAIANREFVDDRIRRGLLVAPFHVEAERVDPGS
jgi:DNA-binding transcriptional LysR family regulator